MTLTFEDFQTSLDLKLLELPRIVQYKLIARCPACAAVGRDNKAEHLIIRPDGRYGCVTHPKDKEHRGRIFALVGLRGNRQRNAEESRRHQQERAERHYLEFQNRSLNIAAHAGRDRILTEYSWDFQSMLMDSPQTGSDTAIGLRYDACHFLASLFSADSLLWTGKVNESGVDGKFANRWRTCRDWCSIQSGERIGPMVSPSIWLPGTVSRSKDNIISAPYLVLDFDEFDGVKPSTPREFAAHLRASLAVIRWLREHQHWQLAAILWTGNKSLHAWFHSPPPAVVESLLTVARTLGMDAGLIGHPEHPCRLPGQRHEKNGVRSRVLWLQYAAQHIS